MDLEASPALDRLRDEVREFIAAKAPAVRFKAGTRAPESEEEFEATRRWVAALYEAQYLGAEWPEEFGGLGRERDPQEQAVIAEELARARVPGYLGAGGLVAGALLAFGTDAQRRRYLPTIRSMDEIWCQLFSEPNAGSDLAGLETRAVPDGDDWVVNGQKVWTTNGQWADFGYLLARTDPEAKKQAGITAFIVDMRSRGVEVRPLREITGTADFNEVFLTDVRVPAENAIGAVNEGWTVATTSLAQERGGVASNVVRAQQDVADLTALATGAEIDGERAWERDDVRQELAALYTRARVCELLTVAAMNRASKGTSSVADAPVGKVFYSELNLDVATAALRLQGSASVLTEPDARALAGGYWQDSFLYARAYTIAGGSNEIMRNMLAERALGLPREPKPASS